MKDTERRTEGWVADRSGFVMPVVIFALLIISAIAVASLMTSDDEQRSARALRESGAAFYAAEAGLNKTYAEWGDYESAFDALGPGDSLDLGRQQLTDRTSYEILIRRVDNDSLGEQRVFDIESEGRFDDGRARSRLALTVVVSSGTLFTPRGAINPITGFEKKGSSGRVSGIDACTGDTLAGAFGPDSLITQNGNPVGPGTRWLAGRPKVEWGGTPDAVAAALGIDWESILAAEPDIYVSASDPWPPASAFDDWPIVVVEEGASVGRGRGLLIAPGDMTVNGNWSWDGLALVGRRFRSNGTMTLNGALVTGLNHVLGDPDVPSDLGNGTKTINYNSCFVREASQALEFRYAPGSWRYLY